MRHNMGVQRKIIFRGFWNRWVFKYKTQWVTIIILQILFFTVSALVPFTWGKVTDSLVVLNRLHLLKWVAIFFATEILQIVLLYSRGFSMRKLEIKVDQDIKTGLYSKLHTMPYANALNIKTGEAIQRIMDDVAHCIPLIVQLFSELLGHLVLILLILVLMFILSPLLTAVSFCFIGLYAVGYYFYQKRAPKYVRLRQHAQATFITSLEEGMEASYSVRVQGLYPGVIKIFTDSLRDYLAKGFAFYKFSLLFQGVFSSGITLLMEAGIIALGAWQVLAGGLTVGTIISFSLYINWLVVFVNYLSSYAATVEPALVSLDRINQIMDQPDAWDYTQIVPASNTETETAIKIEQLDYNFGDHSIFTNLCLSIPAGQITLVKATSGWGKSTLLNLLFKLYPVNDDTIWVFERDLNQIPISELLGLISVIEQEPKFFGGDLVSSITGAAEKMTLEQLLQHSEMLGLRPLLEELLSRTESKGKLRELSGGERKRLGILRGYLRSAPIVALDEPTAFLDKATAESIMEKIFVANENRTVLVFSHDPLVKSFANNVIEF